MKPNAVLAGLLGLQLAALAITWWPAAPETMTETVVFPGGANAIRALEIHPPPAEGAAGKPVQLVRQGEGWSLLSAEGYPAKTETVDAVLDHLGGITLADPLTTQATSHAALQVSEDAYTRKITASVGGETTTLFLGAGPGSLTRIRVAGQDAVYQVRGFSAWSIGDTDARFWDPEVIAAKVDELEQLRFDTPSGPVSLVLRDGVWSDETGAHPIGPREASRLVKALTTLRMQRPLGATDNPSWGIADGIHVAWTGRTVDGTAYVGGYRIGVGLDDLRAVRADGGAWTAAVPSAALEPLLAFDWAKLMPTPAPAFE
jgi:hypothetical protein